MILQSLLVTLLVTCVLVALGWPLTARLRGELGWAAAFVAAACVALAIVVPVTFVVSLAGAPWPWALLVGALATALVSRPLAEGRRAAELPAAAGSRLFRGADLALLLACAALFVAQVVRAPLWSWDHFAIWGVKARRLVGEGGLDLAFLDWPELAPARVDHPLGLPLSWLVLTLGRPPEMNDFKALHVLMGIGLLLVVRGAVHRSMKSWAWGNLAAAMLALSPLFWDTEAVGLAELPLALWAACGVAVLFSAKGRAGSAAAGGLVLGFLPWLKSEGFPLAILLFAVFAWTADRPAARPWRSLAPAAVTLAAGLLGAWCVGRFVLPPGASFFLGDWPQRGIARLSQAREIAVFCAHELLAWDWLLFWPVLALGSLLAVFRRRWRSAALAAAVWLQVAIYGGVAFVTYLDPIPHLQAAFFRISAALVPLGLIALAELFGEERARPHAGAGTGERERRGHAKGQETPRRPSERNPARPLAALRITAVLSIALTVTGFTAAGCVADGTDREPAADQPAAAGEPPPDTADEVVRSETPPPVDEDLDTPGAAVSVLVDYFAAITRRDFAAAHALWGGDGTASGQSLEDFREAHAQSELDSVEIGEPGRIEPAAGSRWIAIPVEIRSTLADGTGQCLRGSATLRRSEVPGATPEQRRWRLDSTDFAPCPAAGAAADRDGVPNDAEPPDAEEGTDEVDGATVDRGGDDDPSPTEAPVASPAAAEARALVERFGRRLGRVSLLAPADALRERIRSEYGPLVTPRLLERWLADPTAAPGRQTSSPAPDRIEVGEVLPRPEGGFTVRGEVVLVTSVERTAGGDAGRQAVELTVVTGAGGDWRIARYARR